MIYQPKEDSYLLKSIIKNYAKNKTVLDVGSGSGIQTVEAIKQKAKSVTASDIDPETITHLKSLDQNIQVIESDLFQNIEEKFDLIIFNPPYLPLDKREDEESKKATTGGKRGDEIILKFLEQSKQNLNSDGKILLLLSSLTPRSRIKTLLNKQKLKHKPITKKALFMETLEVWEIQ